jgi:hypothetical protein
MSEPMSEKSKRVEVTIGIEEEWIDRLMNAVGEIENWGTTDDRSPASCLEDAIKSYVRLLEKDLEDERRRMEERDDSDVPF